MYDFVSSPNHIFVSCQHTTIKVSKFYRFQGSFSSGFDNFSPAGLFQKLAKPCEGVWPCIDGFVYDFRVLWGGMTAKCLMATFCLAKMKEKTYMFNEKNAIDQGILATSKTLAVSNAMYLACEQALLFGRAKRAARERASERRSREGPPPAVASLLACLSRVYFSRYPPNGELARRLQCTFLNNT